MTTSSAPARRADDRPERAPTAQPDRVGQATAIEQTRAVSEIYYRVLAAQQLPRNLDAAVAEMQRVCGTYRLAEKAHYSVPRGGKTVEGPSIHLARELARVWGNIDYGYHELSSDLEHGESEFMAFAWDLQTNTRSSGAFLVPHRRDKRSAAQGWERLTSVADVYQNNVNQASRRVRQAIFSVLPDWFVAEAEDICVRTRAEGGGEGLTKRVTDAVYAFSNDYGVTEAQLVKQVGLPRSAWGGGHVAQLQTLYRSLKAGELTVAEAFPGTRVSEDELDQQTAARRRRAAPTTTTDPEPPPAEPEPSPGNGDEVDQLWSQVYAFAPRDWDEARVHQDFEGWARTTVARATADEVRRYVAHLQAP